MAIKINPEYLGVYNLRGRNIPIIFEGIALCGLDRKEDALVDFSKAIEINSHHAEAYYNRGK